MTSRKLWSLALGTLLFFTTVLSIRLVPQEARAQGNGYYGSPSATLSVLDAGSVTLDGDVTGGSGYVLIFD